MRCEILLITAINFFIAKKMNCAFLIMTNNNYGRKCLSTMLELEPCNDIFKVISDILAHCYCHVTKCFCYQLELDSFNVMFKVISDMLAFRYEMRNALIFTINFCNAQRLNCEFMFMISIIKEENGFVIYYCWNHAMICLT